jgi:phospholipase A2
VGSRLYVPDDLSKLDPRHLKLSNQRHLIENGDLPLPIYSAIRHDLALISEAKDQNSEDKKTSACEGKVSTDAAIEKLDKERRTIQHARQAWQWFEMTPFEVCLEYYSILRRMMV